MASRRVCSVRSELTADIAWIKVLASMEPSSENIARSRWKNEYLDDVDRPSTRCRSDSSSLLAVDPKPAKIFASGLVHSHHHIRHSDVSPAIVMCGNPRFSVQAGLLIEPPMSEMRVRRGKAALFQWVLGWSEALARAS